MAFDDDESLPWIPDIDNPPFEFTSPHNFNYNCVGWALGSTDRYIWPFGGLTSAGVEWPTGVDREETVPAFTEMLRTEGYESCGMDGSPEDGVTKVALYATNGRVPAHLARMLPDGSWTSKVGDGADVGHPNATDVESRAYGRLIGFYRRINP